MRFTLLLLLFSVTALTGAVAAESPPVRTARMTATLVSDTDAVAAGVPMHLDLRLQMAPGWHTYWRNPGDAGVAPELTLNVAAGSIVWPAPERLPEGPLDDVWLHRVGRVAGGGHAGHGRAACHRDGRLAGMPEDLRAGGGSVLARSAGRAAGAVGGSALIRGGGGADPEGVAVHGACGGGWDPVAGGRRAVAGHGGRCVVHPGWGWGDSAQRTADRGGQ